MKLNITWKKTRLLIEGYILIKYNVISDLMRFVRHTANFAGEKLNEITSGINEISGQVTRTADAVNYQTESVAANFSNADKSIFQMSISVIIIFALLYRFGPVLYAMFLDSIRGDKKAASGDKKAARGETKATSGKTKSTRGAKEARFNKWVSRYGKDYRTKKEAQQAFTAFEKDMGYN